MIRSKTDYDYYLEADRIARNVSKPSGFMAKLNSWLYPDAIGEFMQVLRKLEYYENCKTDLLSKIQKIFILRKFQKLSYKLGFSIPTHVFGPGLAIVHYGTIIVNSGAKVGANCRLHACVNIGTAAGSNENAPTIGDNCYIGPGVKLYGDITLANGIAVGANAVVNKSFLEENCAIAGVPAQKIGDSNTLDYIFPATLIMSESK